MKREEKVRERDAKGTEGSKIRAKNTGLQPEKMPRQDAKIKFLRITAKNSSCKLIEMSQQLINERQISRTSKRSVKARKIKT